MHQKLVPQVAAEFLWESKARVSINFTPGSGAVEKAALGLGIKCIVICHNDAHVKTLKAILSKFICDDYAQNSDPSLSRFATPDLKVDCQSVKVERLTLYESQRKPC